ncbi:MAG: type II secretion system protein, partial [Candidatus Woesebacteria bacterium]|nr:type II secretion system protein [Candidatus Woesebacteria bacterium]
MSKTKGFTLIELLIVIGILAILATTVVLVLNPAQILAESRDTQRISDLGTVNSAIGLYLATAASPGLGGANGVACPAGGLVLWRASHAVGFAFGQPFATPDTAVLVAAGTRATDGNGWVAVDLQDTSGGSPIGTLPIDPAPVAATAAIGLDGAARFYAYQCSGNTYEINASMESSKFSSGTSNVEDSDGGTSACSGTGIASARC